MPKESGPCMCGDSQCPSCGFAQGTLERDETELDSIMAEVRIWLTEGTPKQLKCRLAKLELLMKWGLVTADQAVEILSRY